MNRGVWAPAVLAAAALAAGPAQACRAPQYVLSVTFDEAPPELAHEPLALRVKITSVQNTGAARRSGGPSAWARVIGVEKGAFQGREVRIALRATSCGPFPRVGDTGLIVGRLETAADGRPSFIPRLDSPAKREARRKKLRP